MQVVCLWFNCLYVSETLFRGPRAMNWHSQTSVLLVFVYLVMWLNMYKPVRCVHLVELQGTYPYAFSACFCPLSSLVFYFSKFCHLSPCLYILPLSWSSLTDSWLESLSPMSWIHPKFTHPLVHGPYLMILCTFGLKNSQKSQWSMSRWEVSRLERLCMFTFIEPAGDR